MPIGVAVITAGGLVAGGAMSSKAAKSASKSQEATAREALAEQKRIYDIEDAKDKEQRQYDRGETRRVQSARQNAFGGFGSDLSRFSKGYAPAYGMSAEQSQGMLDSRNQSFSSGMGGRQPNMGQEPAMGQAPVMGPGMPQTMPNAPFERMPGPSSMTPKVWLQAPTGEQAQVPIEHVPQMLKKGAVIIPTPQGAR
jgi:hypothetical protein